MARLRIPHPARPIFTTTLEIRVSDVNYGSHLGNDRLLALLHEARVRFLSCYGVQETGNDHYPGIILLDVSLAFASEAFLGEVLEIDIALSELQRGSFTLHYGARAGDGRSVATATSTCVFFDYTHRKVAAVPKELAAQWQTSLEKTQ
ncbi:acyl-CoA thioesterase [Chitinibacteraceae bacterium HSL-7]